MALDCMAFRARVRATQSRKLSRAPGTCWNFSRSRQDPPTVSYEALLLLPFPHPPHYSSLFLVILSSSIFVRRYCPFHRRFAAARLPPLTLCLFFPSFNRLDSIARDAHPRPAIRLVHQSNSRFNKSRRRTNLARIP